MWFMHGGQFILVKFECLALSRLKAFVRIRKSQSSIELMDEMEWPLWKMIKMVVDDG